MFDPKCYELAEHFLPGDASQDRKNAFAQDIQDYVELMLFEPEPRPDKPVPETVKQMRAATARLLGS